MEDSSDSHDISKVYCEKCDGVFTSQKKYEKHLDEHAGVSCESCPLDVIVEKLAKFFRKKSS